MTPRICIPLPLQHFAPLFPQLSQLLLLLLLLSLKFLLIWQLCLRSTDHLNQRLCTLIAISLLDSSLCCPYPSPCLHAALVQQRKMQAQTLPFTFQFLQLIAMNPQLFNQLLPVPLIPTLNTALHLQFLVFE
jgi:hypothetical protein